MTYTKHTWETGDIITATGLNNLEEGVETSISKIEIISATVDDTSITLSKTLKEIAEIITNSFVVISFSMVSGSHLQYHVSNVTNTTDMHIVTAFFGSEYIIFEATTENDYPVVYLSD